MCDVSFMNKEQLLIVLGLVRDGDGRVLLAKRVDNSIPDAYGKWELPGGKVDFGETPETALVREIKEETGLYVRIVGMLPKVYTHVWNNTEGDKSQVFLLTYECSMLNGKLNRQKVRDEIGDLDFFGTQEALELDLLPNVRDALTSFSSV